MPFIACKLPNGLEIRHEGRTITLRGANYGEDIENVSRNGIPTDNIGRAYGYGLTEVSPADAEAFESWKAFVTFEGGKKGGKKLIEPFPAVENGSILGPFGTKEEAISEVGSLHTVVKTGVEGLNPEEEGTEQNKIEDDDTDKGEAGVKRRKVN